MYRGSGNQCGKSVTDRGRRVAAAIAKRPPRHPAHGLCVRREAYVKGAGGVGFQGGVLSVSLLSARVRCFAWAVLLYLAIAAGAPATALTGAPRPCRAMQTKIP